MVVSVLSEYSLPEVTVSQSKHPPSFQLLILSSNIALLLSRCLPSSPQCESCRCTYTTLWILWILCCVLMYVLACVRPMLYLQCPLGSVGDDNLWTLKVPTAHFDLTSQCFSYPTLFTDLVHVQFECTTRAQITGQLPSAWYWIKNTHCH